jgi:queuosine precursor transporter
MKTLAFLHVLLLTLSNVLVQYPFDLLGFHTTYGAFTYPAIFILTDLTTRLTCANHARKIIFRSMFPGLIISYFVASYFAAADTQDLFTLHIMPLRIALACFIAYVVGQLLDILVFQRYRNNTSWWLAPILSTTIGNVVDTIIFFSVAFYQCNDVFLRNHWLEIATVDIFFKIAISVLAFVPIYGFVLNIAKWPFIMALRARTIS